MITMLNNLRISLKIGLAFALLCLVIVASGAVNVAAFVELNQAERRLDEIGQFNVTVDEFDAVTAQQRQRLLEFMLTGERDHLTAYQRLQPRFTALRDDLGRAAPAGVPAGLLEAALSAETQLHEQLFEPQIALMRRVDTVAEARALEITLLRQTLMQARNDAFEALHTWSVEALASAQAQQAHAIGLVETATYATVSIILVLAVVMALTLTRLIARPINGMSGFMDRLSDGDLSDADVPGLGRADEVGTMAQSVSVFRQGLIQARDLAEQQEAEQAHKEAEQKRMRKLVQSFESTIISVLDGLSNADALLRETAQRMTDGADATASKSNQASETASQASNDVNTVASSAEELSASIKEISGRVSQATTVASQAVGEARSSSREIEQLNASVARISEVVDMINDIASQTNLLALNATIEAARAGDAGKGFAVVANEVKTLATQTARATEEVSSQIGAIQAATASAVSSIRKVTGIISEMDEIASSIAAAVEEQGAATAEIARGAEHTAGATTQVVSVMDDLRATAADAGRIAKDLAEAQAKISAQADSLKHEVREFLSSVQHTDDEEPADLVTFTDAHVLGDPTIDAEHRKLMEMTNELYRAVKEGREQSVLDACYRHLKSYSTEHFAGEDAFMQRSGYPERETHMRHHAQFVERLSDLYAAFRAGESSAGIDLLAFLGSWWRVHMAEDDTALARFAREHKGATRAA